MKSATYDPDIFAVRDLEAARRVILTPDGERETDERWSTESPYLARLVADSLAPGTEDLVLDYGCGVGRVAEPVIAATGCRVLGVDMSAEMRSLAVQAVQTPRFAVAGRSMLDGLAAHGLRLHSAFSVWVLQHIPNVEADIALLRRAIAPGGKLLVVNLVGRAIPTTEAGWIDDGKDVRRALCQAFQEIETGVLDPEAVGSRVSAHSFWGLYG